MTTLTARPVAAHPMTSNKDVTRICHPLSPLENEVCSNYMDFGRRTPLYVYGDREGTVAIDEIVMGLAELQKNGFMVE